MSDVVIQFIVQNIFPRLQSKTTSQSSLEEYRGKVEKELPIIYVLGIIASFMHLFAGVAWEKVPISQTQGIKLKVPYLGGFLILISIGFMLTFAYLWLTLRKQQELPIYIKRFRVTLSLLLSVVSMALGVVMILRADDYRVSRNSFGGGQYSGLMMLTVIDIILVYICIPHFVYLLYINCRIVRLTKKESQPEDQPGLQREEVAPPSANAMNQEPLPRRQFVNFSNNIRSNSSLPSEHIPRLQSSMPIEFEQMRVSTRTNFLKMNHEQSLREDEPNQVVSIEHNLPVEQ